MINEEKVILMTKASLYEKKEEKKKLKITRYFRHDYISLQMLTGWFYATICFLLCAVLWGICHMEYLLDNIHKMDLKDFGWTIVLLYVMVIAVYLCLVYGVCSYRYYKARRSVSAYAHILRKILDIYDQEGKNPVSDIIVEELRDDSFT